MSIQHANSGIVKNNLQLYYNREFQGSFRGESTINLFDLPLSTFQIEGNHSTSFQTNTTTGVPDLVVPGNKNVYYTSYYFTLVATGAWQTEVNRVLMYPRTSLVGSTSYRISFYARSLSGNTALGFAFYGNLANYTANLTTKWQRFEATSNTHPSYPAIEFGNKNSGAMTCQIACIQVESKSYTTPFTLPKTWTPNFTQTTGTISNTTITKGTPGDSWTNARVYSTEGYSIPCYLSFKPSQTNTAQMIALNSDPATGINYTNLDYAWYPNETGNSYIYENGNQIANYGAYTTSTIYQIIYDGTNINYYLDGVLKRSVARSSNSPLYLDSSFYSNGGAVNSLSFGPLSQINRPSNYVIGGGGLLDISGNNYNVDLVSSAIAFDSGGFYFNTNNQGPLIVPSANSVLDGLSNNTHTYDVWFKLLGTPPGSSDGYFFGRLGFHEGFVHLKATPNVIWGLTWYNDNTATSIGYTGALNTWYHGVFVVNVETSMRYLYINGVLVDNATLTKPLKQYASTTAYYLGSASQNYTSNIIVSSAKAYNRALNATEILQNFNATRKTYGI